MSDVNEKTIGLSGYDFNRRKTIEMIGYGRNRRKTIDQPYENTLYELNHMETYVILIKILTIENRFFIS